MTKGRETPYNPLDKRNLGNSIRDEILSRDPIAFADIASIKGAGVYVIYYTGDFAPYQRIADKNRDGAFEQPIYIGKAIPKGGRKGGISADSSLGRSLADRLGQHASSIEEASNLKASDFVVRHLVVDDVWIPLGENVLIEGFQPLWNRAIDGFGNKDPGRRRSKQYKSPWDVLHPGRSFAKKLGDWDLTSTFLEERVDDYLSGRKMKPLPKKIAEQLEDEEADAQDAADEATL
ncbi:hypothetical protein FHT77_004861 [Rhizobium sp. BK181]|uniref:Eco29kI family restriction endonuclease n=1 Tax=Rhizobium sp. BK181 TaxID=2587072 RepID=UPI001615953C|nr:Eco29kI family restriction endonuclease [Rhizobium sp. BK181]MBB3318952.1 hypothetical protein [Rhizobium sp. BK181]